MKWVVYTLLLINISVFVWYFQAGDEPAAVTTEQPEEDKAALQLVLLKEFDERVEVPDNSRQCRTLGPFDNKKQAGLALKVLQTESIQAEQVMRKDAKRKAYWVFLPPAESREAAKKSIAQLKSKNISDYFLVVTGDQINAVSLGVYSKFESAHRRIKQMQDLGFTPRFEKVNLPKREYWLDWPKGSGGAVNEDVLNRIRKIQGNIQIKSQSCV